MIGLAGKAALSSVTKVKPNKKGQEEKKKEKKKRRSWMDELSETGVEYATSLTSPLGDGRWSAQGLAGFCKVIRNR